MANAYDEVPMDTQSQPPSQPQTDAQAQATGAAVSYGQAQAQSQATNLYETTVNDFKQANINQADHNTVPEAPNWAVRCFNWMPLRWFLFVGGLALAALSILDLIIHGSQVKGVGNLIFIFLFCAGIVIMIVEGPVTRVTRGVQLTIYFWFRLLSRLWGRAWFYLFVSLLCFAQFDIGITTASSFAGFYLIIFMVPIMFFVSRNAAQKYQRIFVFVSAGAEGAERDMKFEQKFDELDVAKTGFIGASQIVVLAAQAGRSLTNAERHAIQTFLDANTNGKVSKEDFIVQFREHNLKQRFL